MSERKQIKVTCVVGTRPEAIKMAPLVIALQKDPAFSVTLLASGQHAEMLLQALDYFSLVPDLNLGVMQNCQSLDHVTAAVLTGVGNFLDSCPQDLVLVHGDTTTTLGASLASFYRKIPLGHVEAGLRSHDMSLPFPEEANRVITDHLATLFFAPTSPAAANLLSEGVPASRIFLTGNTVIDALLWTVSHTLPERSSALQPVPNGADLILMTAHRRESWGGALVRMCKAVRSVMRKHPEVYVLIPLHKNPLVRETITTELHGCDKVIFTEPLGYPDFVAAMERSRFIMSDSGGVQEEASALRKPVLILRELSERPEAVSEGTGVLVGTDSARIEQEALRLLEDEAYLQSFSVKKSPFGDGNAASKIVQNIKDYFWR